MLEGRGREIKFVFFSELSSVERLVERQRDRMCFSTLWTRVFFLEVSVFRVLKLIKFGVYEVIRIIG